MQSRQINFNLELSCESNEIIPYVFLCTWLHFLNRKSARHIHLAVWISTVHGPDMRIYSSILLINTWVVSSFMPA